VHLQSVNESLRQIALEHLSRVEAPGQSLTSLIIVTTLPPRKLLPNHCQALI
jgi:hypothetical protein